VSKINLNNYEAFMLDHLEGNLSQQDIIALKAFALLHPELELNFEEELVTLNNESILFDGKQNLKTGFSDELVIGYLENVLNVEEKTQAQELEKNNLVFKYELGLYKRTIVAADASIVFENKERLKRRGAVIFFPQNNFVRVAAALLLLFGLWFMVSRLVKDDVKVSPELANKTKEVKNNVEINTVTPENKTEQAELISNSNTLIAKNTNKTINNIISKQPVNTSTISTIVPIENKEPQLADRVLIKEQPAVVIDTNNTQLANNNTSERIAPKYIIEEGVDDELVSKPKSKLWNFATGLFKGLNRRGIENVNGSETDNEILIGALTISKPN
jgi:hypothetical protein